jgi:hypothetical protein
MHLFPQLRMIEAKYQQQVVVVGVHSPKFPAERDTVNLREAVLRNRIEHHVVNDRDFQVWSLFGGRAWPTLVFVDPEGRIVGKHEGELPFEAFDRLVAEMLREFHARGILKPERAALALELAREPERLLKFPGKVLAAGDSLYVSDNNHHRIVGAGLDGQIRGVIGAGEPGLNDGGPGVACFQQPQGLAISDATLFVADTENHAIRAIELRTWSVRTVAGTGAQGQGFGSGGSGPSTALSSPWDLALAGDRLFIAMAGLHQIWALELDSGWVAPFAGTGREGLKDGALSEAWFAQSSGLALADQHLYVADSEVSAVRDIDLRRGTVSTPVGQGLFVFGDTDGVGDEVRLQHPLGIAEHEGLLYLADSYNGKIKRLDPGTRRVTTWVVGDGSPGPADAGGGARLREPGGVSAGPDGLYVADTNNHRVVLVEWRTGTLRPVIEA